MAWDIHSPSRVFYRIGAFAMMGLSLGAEKEGNNTLKTFHDTMNNISDSIELSSDWQPTITPVVDMTNVRRSSGMLNNLLSSKSTVLAGEESALDVRRREYVFQQNQNRSYDDAKIVNHIEALHRSITKMNDNLANQQIVMDTGALVGATVGPMDTALGRRMQRTKRGG